MKMGPWHSKRYQLQWPGTSDNDVIALSLGVSGSVCISKPAGGDVEQTSFRLDTDAECQLCQGSPANGQVGRSDRWSLR